MIVDFESRDLVATEKVTRAATEGVDISWGEPEMSPGSTPEVPRAIIKGAVQADGATEMELKALVLHIRSRGLPTSTLVATGHIFRDASAPVVELSAPQAGYRIVPLCDEAAYVTPRKLTVKTLVPTDRWEKVLTETHMSDPDCFVPRIKWRPSRNGGRVTAQAEATAGQLAAQCRESNRARKQRADQFPILIIIRPHRELGRNAREAIQGILSHLQRNGIALNEACDGNALEDSQWRAVRGRSDQLVGSMHIAIRDPSAAAQVVSMLHEKAIEVGHELVTIIAAEDGCTAQRSKNGGRGGRPRTPPPTSA